MEQEERRAFILAHTRLQSPPHVPEIILHLADEVTPIWRMTEEELGGLGLPPPFWAFAWAGGQALARYLMDHPDEVRGKRVLDFATGSGVVAIAAAKAGAWHVLAADIDLFSVAALKLNADVNDVEVTSAVGNLLDTDPPSVDVILAGDICYEMPTAGAVVAWLRRAHEVGVRVLIGDPGRTYLPKTELVRLAEYVVATTRELEDSEIKRTSVFTFGPE